jgi:hypothetical protein
MLQLSLFNQVPMNQNPELNTAVMTPQWMENYQWPPYLKKQWEQLVAEDKPHEANALRWEFCVD